jgi:hypothetical protein
LENEKTRLCNFSSLYWGYFGFRQIFIYLLIRNLMVILTKTFINIFCVVMMGFILFFSDSVDPILFPIAMAYCAFLIAPGIIMSNLLLRNSIVFLIVSIFIYGPVSFQQYITPYYLQLLRPNGYPQNDFLFIIILFMTCSALISLLAFFVERNILQKNTRQSRRKLVNPRFRN